MWYATRGTGVVSLILLTAIVCLGVAGVRRLGSRQWPRHLVAGLHRNLTLVALVFLALHIATTVLDGFAPIALQDAVVPFGSAYRPVWLGLGAVAFDLLLALTITSLLRGRFGFRTWRLFHWLAYAAWPIALVHALGTGSDGRVGWMQVLGARPHGSRRRRGDRATGGSLDLAGRTDCSGIGAPARPACPAALVRDGPGGHRLGRSRGYAHVAALAPRRRAEHAGSTCSPARRRRGCLGRPSSLLCAAASRRRRDRRVVCS